MYEPEDRRRFSLRGLLVPLGALVVAALIVGGVAYAFGIIGGDDEPDEAVVTEPTPEPSPTPSVSPQEQAMGDYIRQNLGQDYVGDCSQATAGVPGLCSQNRGERQGVIAFAVGQPLAEPNWWVFMREGGGGAWQAAGAKEITPESLAIPGIPWPLQPGAEVVIVGAAPCLNVREGPALNQAAVDCIADGTPLVLAAGPADSDGFQWWQIDGRAGWIVADYLRYPDAIQ